MGRCEGLAWDDAKTSPRSGQRYSLGRGNVTASVGATSQPRSGQRHSLGRGNVTASVGATLLPRSAVSALRVAERGCAREGGRTDGCPARPDGAGGTTRPPEPRRGVREGGGRCGG
jgi:hypothetical protein